MTPGRWRMAIFGRDLVPGDILITPEGERTITHFEDRRTVNGARVACAGRWQLAIFDDRQIEVLRGAPTSIEAHPGGRP